MADICSNLIHIINEWSVLLLSILSLAFTNHLNANERYFYGTIFLWIVAVVIGIDLLLVLLRWRLASRQTKMIKLEKLLKLKMQKPKK